MAFVTPTPADFQKRFPKFAGVDNDIVAQAIALAASMVDDTWQERDFSEAKSLYAAHILTLDGHGSGVEAETSLSGASGFKVMRSASLTLERFDRKNGGGSTLELTSYGQRFLEILRRNISGVLVVDG